ILAHGEEPWSRLAAVGGDAGAVEGRECAADPGGAGHAVRRPPAALLAADRPRRRADARAADQARRAAGREAGGLPNARRPVRPPGRALPAPRRLPALRLRGGRRRTLRLPRLE